MKSNQILIFGSVVTIILILLWQFDKISEPMAALGGAFLTLISYVLSKNKNSKDDESNTTTITQTNTSGDNIARDKIVK